MAIFPTKHGPDYGLELERREFVTNQKMAKLTVDVQKLVPNPGYPGYTGVCQHGLKNNRNIPTGSFSFVWGMVG